MPADVFQGSPRGVVGFRAHGTGLLLEVLTGADDADGSTRVKRARAGLKKRVAKVLDCCSQAHLLADDVTADGVLVGASFDETQEGVSDSLGRMLITHRVLATAEVPLGLAREYVATHLAIIDVPRRSTLTLDGVAWHL